jgi:hypothetical protein
MKQKHLVFLLEFIRRLELAEKKRNSPRLKEVMISYGITQEDLSDIIEGLMEELINSPEEYANKFNPTTDRLNNRIT